MYTYIHTRIHTYIHTYMLTYIHAYIHTYIHTYMHAYIHACIHIYTHTDAHLDIQKYFLEKILADSDACVDNNTRTQASKQHANSTSLISVLYMAMRAQQHTRSGKYTTCIYHLAQYLVAYSDASIDNKRSGKYAISRY